MKPHLLVAAALTFSLIGVASIGCVAFGIIEIASGDAIFLNDGLGEVLTVLGTYFTIPYLFIFGTFVVSSTNFNCFKFLNRDFGLLPQHAMLLVTLLMFVLQQVVTNMYMRILHGDAALAVIIGDVVVIASFLYFRLQEAHPGMLYALLYMCKMAVMFNNAYKTSQEKFFGPNGVSAMLFLCIPIIQFPLYVAGTWETKRSVNIVEVFVGNFNLYLSHLLHSLDIISMYGVAFLSPDTTESHVGLPGPFKVLIAFCVCIGFVSNNVSVLHLFYQRRGIADAEIVLLPQAIRDMSRGTGAEDIKQSHARRIFQYMIFMLVVCDVPFVIARMELWRKQYAPLSIFVAKNLKDIVDVVMLMKRVDPRNDDVDDSPGPTPTGMQRTQQERVTLL